MDIRHIKWAHKQLYGNAKLEEVAKGVYHSKHSLIIDPDKRDVPEWFIDACKNMQGIIQEIIVLPNGKRIGPSTNHTTLTWSYLKSVHCSKGGKVYQFIEGSYRYNLAVYPLLSLVDSGDYEKVLDKTNAPPSYQSERGLKNHIKKERVYLGMFDRIAELQLMSVPC